MSIDDLIKKVRTLFAAFPVSRAFLFGSSLFKSIDEANDIDILLNLEPGNNLSLIDFSRLQIDLSEQLGKQVDLVTEDSVSELILPIIEKEKLLIYEK